MAIIEPSDSAAFSGTVETRGRPRMIDQATIDREKAALAAAVEADQSKKARKNALQFVAKRFKDQPVPPDNQLLRWIVYPVIGKATRKSRT
jgi:hypothetical protein